MSISGIFEWLGAHPTIELLSILVGGAIFVGILVAVANARAPDLPQMQAPRRRRWRDRDEHADHLGI